MLSQVSSMDVGNPNEPGDYGYNGALVSVDQNHLDTWRDQPSTAFRTILLTRAGDTRIRLALGEQLGAE